MTALTAPQFTDEAAAIAHLEASRWPDGFNCPHCGSLNVHRMAGKTQAGYFLCNDCRDKFTCRTGTVMERSHIPVHKWLLAIHLLSASKKGMSAHQLHRMLGVTYKSAWFLAHRIRTAMGDVADAPMGGEGGFFLNRATEASTALAEDAERQSWFKGSAVGTFDGEIKEADLRGSIPKVIIRLTAGNKDIDCVCPGLSVDDIKSVLNQRVRLTGTAYYDGDSGLPIRIEVTSIPIPIKRAVDFTRWRGSFETFAPEWDGDH